MPSCICTMIDSLITIALSTNMPKAMMSAAIEIWSSPISKNCMRTRVVSIAVGISVDTTSPVRKPRDTSITRSTIPIACSRFSMKEST